MKFTNPLNFCVCSKLKNSEFQAHNIFALSKLGRIVSFGTYINMFELSNRAKIVARFKIRAEL